MIENISKIFAVSLTHKQKFKAFAVYNGEQLVIQAVQPITGLFKSWKKPIIDEIKERKAKNFTVLVEEKTDYIARYATSFLFDQKDEWENRINYYVVLDWYFALENSGNLIFPRDGKKYQIREQNIDRQQDDQGRTKYNINWEVFTGGHRAVLLCVAAAMMQPLTGNYLETMYNQLLESDVSSEFNPVRAWETITFGADKEKAVKINEAMAERKRIDELRKQEG